MTWVLRLPDAPAQKGVRTGPLRSGRSSSRSPSCGREGSAISELGECGFQAVLVLEEAVEVEQLVMVDGSAEAAGLRQLERRAPGRVGDTGGDEEVDRAGLRGLHDRHRAHRAAER